MGNMISHEKGLICTRNVEDVMCNSQYTHHTLYIVIYFQNKNPKQIAKSKTIQKIFRKCNWKLNNMETKYNFSYKTK